MTPPVTQPVIAMIHVVPTPYWVHLHHRLAAELPEIDLRVAYAHDLPNQSWNLDLSTDVNAVSFGTGKPWDHRSLIRVTREEWAKAGRIIRWIRAQRAHAVVMSGYNDAGRVRILLWCRRNGIPLLLHGDSNIHGDRATGLRKLLKRLIVGRVVRSCAAVLPFGTAGRRYFARYGARADRTFFMPGEPDYALIERVTEGDIAAAMASCSLAPGRRRLVFSGRLIPLKRVADLIDAFAMVAPDHPDWDLVIVGDGPLRDELAARVPSPLRHRVHWCGFVQEPARLAAIYRACDLLVLPSDQDAWALVVNEALAAGLAVIVSNVVGAADDLVREGMNGGLFTPGDVPGLAACLRSAMEPPTLARYKSAAAEVLRDWRRRGNPVEGLRSALVTVGVLTPRPSPPAPGGSV